MVADTFNTFCTSAALCLKEIALEKSPEACGVKVNFTSSDPPASIIKGKLISKLIAVAS